MSIVSDNRNGKRILQNWTIVVIVLMLSLYLGAAPALLGSEKASLPIIAFVAGIGFMIFGSRPILGIYTILATANTVTVEIGTGSNTGLNIAFIISSALVASWIVGMLIRREISLTPSLLNRPALLLVGLFGLSLLIGRIHWIQGVGRLTSMQVQIAQVMLVWLSMGIMLLTGNRVTERELRRFTYLFLALCTAAVINAFGASLFSFPYLFEDTVGMFPSLVAALGLGLARYDTRLPLMLRLGLVALVAAWFVWGAVLAVELASAWVPILCGLAVMLFFYSKKGFVLATVAGMALVALFPQRMLAPFKAVLDEGTIYRGDLWLKVINTTRPSPIFGLGPANYQPYTLRSIAFNPETYRHLPDYTWEMPSHNQYVDLFAQSGLLGLFAYIWLLAAALITARRIYLHGRDGFSRGYGLAMTGVVSAMAAVGIIGDWILPYVYNIGIKGFRQSVFTWIFLGGLIILHQRLARPDQTTAAEDVEEDSAA